jgi:hypothetical protein
MEADFFIKKSADHFIVIIFKYKKCFYNMDIIFKYKKMFL